VLHHLRWWPSAGAVGRKRRSSGREEEKEGNDSFNHILYTKKMHLGEMNPF
jgi:hypothetical protein